MALVIRNRNNGYMLQRLVSASHAASPRMQRFLRYENAHGSDIYVSMNTLKPEAKGRTRADIAEIRHLYLDLDEDCPPPEGYRKPRAAPAELRARHFTRQTSGHLACRRLHTGAARSNPP